MKKLKKYLLREDCLLEITNSIRRSHIILKWHSQYSDDVANIKGMQVSMRIKCFIAASSKKIRDECRKAIKENDTLIRYKMVFGEGTLPDFAERFKFKIADLPDANAAKLYWEVWKQEVKE